MLYSLTMLRDRKTVLFLGDIAALIAALFVMVLIRFSNEIFFVQLREQTRIFFLLFIFWLVIFFIFDLYNVRRVNPNPRNIGLLSLGVVTASVLSVLYFYIFPTNGTPKTNLFVFALSALVFLILWRRTFYKLYTSRYRQLIGIIGHGPAVEALTADIKNHPQIGSIIEIDNRYNSAESLPAVDLLIAHDVKLETLVSVARTKQCDILSLAEAYEELFGKVPLTLLTEEKAISVFARQKNLAYRTIERLIEIILAVLILVVVSPFIIIAALAILIEDGSPIVYSQLRVGKNGVPFSIYKLRTMKKDAESNGAQWATPHDSRVTMVGHILRKTHLDEVLQMVNVIKGDIAFIGPRPERPEFVAELEQHIPYYFLRHTVKPGFTGWAQIKYRYARSQMDSEDKFAYDLYYLFKKNTLLDIGIFLKTIQIIFTH